MTAVPRLLYAALSAMCVLALAAPAQAAKPTLSIKAPAAGDMTLAHVVISTEGGKGPPKLVLTNKSKLSARLTVAGGVKKLKKNRYLASIAVLLKTGGGGGTPAFKFTFPKGMKFTKFSSKVIAKNLLAGGAKPSFCAAVPASFEYVAKKLLAGSLVPRFPTVFEYVSAGYQLGCSDYEDRANLAAALRGEPDPGAGGGGTGGGGAGDEDEDEDEDFGGGGGGGGAVSQMQGSGTVIAEGGGVFSYQVKFNEPIYSITFDAWGEVRCPTQYGAWKADECDTIGSQTATGGGQSLACGDSEYTYQFACGTPAGTRGQPGSRPTVPADTTIVGRFKLSAGVPPSGTAKMLAHGPSGRSQQFALSGP